MGPIFVDNIFLRFSGFQERLGFVVTAFEIIVVGATDFCVGMMLHFPSLFPSL